MVDNMSKSCKFCLVQAKDSDVEALVDVLLDDKRVVGVSAADHKDGYSVAVKFGERMAPTNAMAYLSKKIPKRFGTLKT